MAGKIIFRIGISLEEIDREIVANVEIADRYAVCDDLKTMQDLSLSSQPAPFDWVAFAPEANTR